jgi:molybdenum cofactor guanylyltransferase
MSLLPESCEICILAGGLSSRMGRNKARVRIGPRSLLRHIHETARALQRPVRILRHDLVCRSGPVGGIITALRTTHAEHVLFLACDMPLVPASYLRALLQRTAPPDDGVFTATEQGLGFPFLVRKAALPRLENFFASGQRSLQRLASELKISIHSPAPEERALFLNINTPEDLLRARELWGAGTVFGNATINPPT